MARTNQDTYQMWVQSGKWPEVRSFIVDCIKKRVSQKEISERLNMDEATFSRLKSKHKEIQDAIDEAKLNTKKDLMNAMYKLAMGYEEITEDQVIEDDGSGKKQKRKIHKVKRNVGPDYKALCYLMTKLFGPEFSDKAEELALQVKKMESQKEDWSNGSIKNSK